MGARAGSGGTWAPEFPAIDELPATYTLRPLAVISIVEQVAKDPGYHLQVADIERWEARDGPIPEGSVVMVELGLVQRLAEPGARAAQKLNRECPWLPLNSSMKAPYPVFMATNPGHRYHANAGRECGGVVHNGYAQAEGVGRPGSGGRDGLPDRFN